MTIPFEKIDAYRWRIPKSYKKGMRVDGIVYADEKLLKTPGMDKAAEQVANVAFLPGIVKYSLAMPDIHWGYGFPIGGVAATDPDKGGVISPGGVGYDINCGVRLVKTHLSGDEVKPKIKTLVVALFNEIPCGVGRSGHFRFSASEEKTLVERGAPYIVKKGWGRPEDLETTEARGSLQGADPSQVSKRAFERGSDQCGTLGSGNHFLEVQVIDEIYDSNIADRWGLFMEQVTVMIHSGSRALGYQVCDDYLRKMAHCPEKYGISLPDRQLVCAPVKSEEGKNYIAAMNAAANFAWANRQLLLHQTRRVFEKVFGKSEEKLGLDQVYDVAHNIAKFETYTVDGETKTLCVHRKGATRAYPAGLAELPETYRDLGQPVIIPGDMGRNSFLLVGQPGSMTETFGSTCHGAGRLMSRSRAIHESRGRDIQKELEEERGVIAMARGRTGLIEEQPDAYKDVSQVVSVVEKAGLSKRVCRMKPIGVIKG